MNARRAHCRFIDSTFDPGFHPHSDGAIPSTAPMHDEFRAKVWRCQLSGELKSSNLLPQSPGKTMGSDKPRSQTNRHAAFGNGL
jgi:hypothetical protein